MAGTTCDLEEEVLPRKTSALERHLQTFILMAALMVLGWVGHSLETGNENAARLDERILAINQSIKELKETAGRVYTRSDADRDFQAVNGQISDLRGRVYAVEGAIHDRNATKPPVPDIKEWSRKN